MTEHSAEDMHRFREFILRHRRQGTARYTIAERLTEFGVERNDALKLVDDTEEQQKYTSDGATDHEGLGLAAGLVGGALAAVVGGVAWGLIVIATDYEVGYMAIGMGALAGAAVVLFSGGKRNFALQLIAVVASIIGIVIGKYVTFYHFLKLELIEQHGPEAADKLSLFSPEMFDAFGNGIKFMVNPYDILWIVFAVVAAWGIAKPSAVKQP
ncbi:MAG: hypothetical protein RDV41_02855 [Planctomycetota bacterium]|nr:hypothetical protein [Planctomycetota bacterium]